KDETGKRRLDDDHDWVRIEIETALATAGVLVVPVLVNGARMPRGEEVPDSLKPLLRRNAAIIRRDPDFHDDIERLATAIRSSVNTGIIDLSKIGGKSAGPAPAPSRERTNRTPLLIGGAIATALILVAIGFGVSRWLPTQGAETVEEQTAAVEPAPQDAGPGQTFRDCADCPEMVVIPAGSFTMGSPASEPTRSADEGLQRRITFATNFAVGRFEVTRGQYAAFTRATGRAASNNCYTDRDNNGSWEQDANGTWRDPGYAQGEDHPVVCVSWDDAQAFVQWLNSQTRGGYRLLSEAEWEYAARAGASSAYPWGASASHEYANYGADACCSGLVSGRDQWVNTSPAGQFPANAFGVSDMNGNVWEWTQDCYE
ncbi:MAG: SUMF1/EgtB/PvdO family nonheme iron enzyme, partial [Terricaulis sp.]